MTLQICLPLTLWTILRASRTNCHPLNKNTMNLGTLHGLWNIDKADELSQFEENHCGLFSVIGTDLDPRLRLPSFQSVDLMSDSSATVFLPLSKMCGLGTALDSSLSSRRWHHLCSCELIALSHSPHLKPQFSQLWLITSTLRRYTGASNSEFLKCNLLFSPQILLFLLKLLHWWVELPQACNKDANVCVYLSKFFTVENEFSLHCC